MILEEFLHRLKVEHHTVDKLTQETYYQRLSSLFVVLELDGDNLNEEHDLGLDAILDKMNDINEDDLQLDMSPEDLAVLVKKVKTGLAILITKIEE
ncbi:MULTISPECIES: hypothetical protein [unclassified Mucilaginibacter]|uniref:hypothetical protein n=1 Tax=unclassified Mucilaginibacter TaxID=2617802 RepID=UPI002AC9EE04|nr:MULTISPECIES: hypothetical protein [unclassified Mucilaginibacter]MEB0260398.1 hypothetical protein [Mucilaginibacter sp. 10I4]MEB0279437.1 hypothetical protein [Mucilaginibacter sp. 10B2]MEB0299997.1 hypothetical protein [Mucilaginibacter sp. 5C4]WPX21811.1 hypothetical protein RHM67_10985 [Mucilaginibacter sp. 5C4]